MKKSYYNDEELLSRRGAELSNEIEQALRQIIDREIAAGYSTIELDQIISTTIGCHLAGIRIWGRINAEEGKN